MADMISMSSSILRGPGEARPDFERGGSDLAAIRLGSVYEYQRHLMREQSRAEGSVRESSSIADGGPPEMSRIEDR